MLEACLCQVIICCFVPWLSLLSAGKNKSELGPVIRKDVLLYSSTRNAHICQGRLAVCDSGCMSERKIQVLTVNFCVIGQLWW